MKDEVFKNWISSILGLAMVVFAGVLLFVETRIELPVLVIGAIAAVGIALIFAKDKIVSLLIKKIDTNNK